MVSEHANSPLQERSPVLVLVGEIAQDRASKQEARGKKGLVWFPFRNGQLLPMKDAYKLAIDAFDILVKQKTLGRVSPALVQLQGFAASAGLRAPKALRFSLKHGDRGCALDTGISREAPIRLSSLCEH